MNRKSINLHKFIAEFNFPDPDWDSLPVGFPNLSKEDLTLEEECLLDGIILAWTATHRNGIKKLYQNITKAGLSFVILLIGIISLIGIFTQPSGNKFTRTVNAAGVQVDDFVQSTMSAILRK